MAPLIFSEVLPIWYYAEYRLVEGTTAGRLVVMENSRPEKQFRREQRHA